MDRVPVTLNLCILCLLADSVTGQQSSHCSASICREGYSPITNSSHIPSANGCGPTWLRVTRGILHNEDVETCCNLHDVCYDTCNSDRDICDQEFKACLDASCFKHKNWNFYCKSLAMLFHELVSRHGCSSYLSAQRAACVCWPWMFAILYQCFVFLCWTILLIALFYLTYEFFHCLDYL